MITSMRGCVAYNDLWPWPIFSRSFGLDFENRVRSVASTLLDGFFPYLVQMITSMGRCVACCDLWTWPISSRSFDLDFENRVRSVTFSVLDRLFFWLGIQYDSIVWVIMRRRGVSSERRLSSCSSSIYCIHTNEFSLSWNTERSREISRQTFWKKKFPWRNDFRGILALCARVAVGAIMSECGCCTVIFHLNQCCLVTPYGHRALDQRWLG